MVGPPSQRDGVKLDNSAAELGRMNRWGARELSRGKHAKENEGETDLEWKGGSRSKRFGRRCT